MTKQSGTTSEGTQQTAKDNKKAREWRRVRPGVFMLENLSSWVVWTRNEELTQVGMMKIKLLFFQSRGLLFQRTL